MILLAPHNDDEALFASYIILRYRPLVVVVTDSFVQYERGQEEITAHRRRDETRRAMQVLGAEVQFLGLADDRLRGGVLQGALKQFGQVPVISPAYQGGHPQHDLVHIVAMQMFRWNAYYATYAKDQWLTPIARYVEVVPCPAEAELKKKALACYESQHWQGHFGAVEGKSEWISEVP